ncbi:MAG: LacI family transcriptional regulator [Anaerohalosphaeraceae bacterium]|nr:LacI family transcriptional regulator [Anaerohalosphaeraceae bacterium]
MATTLSSIAEKLSISRGTVSRALRDDSQISISTRNRIKSLAKEMNYKPNLVARGLSLGKTQTIGFLAGSPSLEITSTMEAKLDELANNAGYEVYVAHTKGNLDITVKRAHKLIGRGVDGLIVKGAFPEATVKEIQTKLKFSVPTVLFSGTLFGKSAYSSHRLVCQDVSIGIRKAINHLYRLGHSQIYMFSMCWPGWEKDMRFIEFYKSIESHGFGKGQDRLYSTDESYANKGTRHIIDVDLAFLQTKKFLKSHPECTAIICIQSEFALFLTSALARMGIRVPQDISIVGFDDVSTMAYSQPPLSTIAQPVEEMVNSAFELLMEGIERDIDEPKQIAIPSKFIIRQSAGEVRSEKKISITEK